MLSPQAGLYIEFAECTCHIEVGGINILIVEKVIAPGGKYVLLGFLSVSYFLVFMKWCNWGVTHLFKALNSNPALDNFYVHQAGWYDHSLFSLVLHGPEHLIDPLVFFSIMFMRWAFENEKKRHDLERDHLVLQLETLKAQLHPHFFFNTLNSIYGMSLTGAKTPYGGVGIGNVRKRLALYYPEHHTLQITGNGDV